MKKKLLTLGVAGLLAGSPSVHAESDSIKMETKKDLVETVTTSKQNKSKDSTTISFEEGKKLLEEKELIEKVLNDEEVQAVIETYGKENIEKIIKEVIKSQDTEKIVKKAMENKEVQKALKEGNKKEFEELIKEIGEGYYKDYYKDPLWVRIVNVICIVLGREFGKKISKKMME